MGSRSTALLGSSLLALALTVGARDAAARHPTPAPPPATSAETAKSEPSNAPFRAKLLANQAVARQAQSTFTSLAKQPAPPKLPADQKKAYAEQSRWLAGGAAKLGSLQAQMQAALAKGTKASAMEIATVNMQFLTLREEMEADGKRFADVTPPARARHMAAIGAIRTPDR